MRTIKSMESRRRTYEATIAVARQRLAIGTEGKKEARMVRDHDADPEQAFRAWIERTDRQMMSATVREKALRPQIIEMLRRFGPVPALEQIRVVLRCDEAALRLAVEGLVAEGKVERNGGARAGDGLRLVARVPSVQQIPMPAAPPDAALRALSDALSRRDAEVAEVRAELARQRQEIARLTALLDEQTRPGGAQ